MLEDKVSPQEDEKIRSSIPRFLCVLFLILGIELALYSKLQQCQEEILSVRDYQ